MARFIEHKKCDKPHQVFVALCRKKKPMQFCIRIKVSSPTFIGFIKAKNYSADHKWQNHSLCCRQSSDNQRALIPEQ